MLATKASAALFYVRMSKAQAASHFSSAVRPKPFNDLQVVSSAVPNWSQAAAGECRSQQCARRSRHGCCKQR